MHTGAGGGAVSTSDAPTAQAAPRYGMVVDLNRCVGCQTCTIACKHHNDTPPGVQWRRVLDVEQGEYPNVERVFLVTGCQHCANPPCVPVCPTGATRQRADGLVTMDYDTCIGCGYCAVACPYQARTIAHERAWYFGTPSRQEAQVFHDERVGVATKCTFCVDKIDEAAQTPGVVPGLDLEATPACAASCIAQALHFGNFVDPDSNVSRLSAENAHFRMHEELGTDPQIRYLYEVPETTPGREPEEADDERLSDPNDPLVGGQQEFWDVRAAMNFILGGMSSGLAVVVYALWALGLMADVLLAWFFAAAALGMGIGLLFVFAEIGRKARFLYVLRRPQSSWMTRETYAVAVFYPAVVADLLWPSPALHAVVAVAAAAFLVCQARILHAGKGIPAWRVDLVPWMIVAAGLYEGVALALLGHFGIVAATSAGLFDSLGIGIGIGIGGGRAGSGMPPPEPIDGVQFVLAPVVLAGAGIVLAMANAALFGAYRRRAAKVGVGPLSLRELDAIAGRMRRLGHVGPAALFATAGIVFVVSFPAGLALIDCEGALKCLALTAVVVVGGPGAPLVFAAAAACVLYGGVLWKHTLVTRACHQQGFALPRIPQRGSGTRAAPARFGIG